MKICVLNTGGTISSVGEPLEPMSADRFAKAAERILGPAIAAKFPSLELQFDIALRFSPEGVGTLDSTNLQPKDWCLIADAVLEAYADYDAFLILHGTDTMDFTGAALPLLLNVFDRYGHGQAILSKPVILTGSQLPLFLDTPDGLVLNAGSDGFANFCGAIEAAMLRIPEVGLFFNGKLFRANRALKTSTRRFAGFDSPHLPPLAEVGIGAWLGHASPLPDPFPDVALTGQLQKAKDQLLAVTQNIDSYPVVQLNAFPASSAASPLAAMIRDTVKAGTRGIVLQSFGEGNFPSGGGIREALQEASDSGVIVVDSTRVIGGQVGAFHYAAGAWIAETGAISGGDMTPMAAFTKLMILLSIAEHHGWSRDDLCNLIELSLAGECHSAELLDTEHFNA